jgi:hypothetical protein
MQSRSDDMTRPFFYYSREDCENLNWGAAAEVFRKISKLLEIRCYQYAVLSGIILSAGGLSECLVRIYSFLQRREHFQPQSVKTWFGNSAKVFVLSFSLRLCCFVHGARSMNTLYFSIMNESSNSNVSVQSFNHAI